VAESGLEGYGEEAAVVEVSFGIAGVEKNWFDRRLRGHKRNLLVRSSEYEGEPYPASRRPGGLGQTETEASERPSS
jgi:hypothetical protein